MRITILTLFISFALSFNLSAQNVPGYLGKKNTIQYGCFAFPSLVNPNKADQRIFNNTILDHALTTTINFQHLLVYQRVVSKNMSLLANVGYNKAYFSMEDVSVGTYVYSDKGADHYSYWYDENPELTALHLNFGFRYFTQHLAPVGKYIEVRLGMARVSCDSFTYNIREDYSVTRTYSYTVAGGSMWRPSIAFGFGNTRIVKDILYLTYGFDLNLFTGGIGYNESFLSTSSSVDVNYGEAAIIDGSEIRKFNPVEPNNPDNQKRYVKTAAGRYTMQCALNFHLALGLVL